MGMTKSDPLRKQLVDLLRMEGAHLEFDSAVARYVDGCRRAARFQNRIDHGALCGADYEIAPELLHSRSFDRQPVGPRNDRWEEINPRSRNSNFRCACSTRRRSSRKLARSSSVRAPLGNAS